MFGQLDEAGVSVELIQVRPEYLKLLGETDYREFEKSSRPRPLLMFDLLADLGESAVTGAVTSRPAAAAVSAARTASGICPSAASRSTRSESRRTAVVLTARPCPGAR